MTSRHELARYYRCAFPVEAVWALLGDPRREWAFGFPGGAFKRHCKYADAAGLRAALAELRPERVDVGAAGERRELVLDVDLSDYDAERTCCAGKEMCGGCWPLAAGAARDLDRALRDQFGYEHVLWLFSGGRGVHAWVCDPAASVLDAEVRAALAESLGQVARIDGPVTAQPGHLLKCPLSVHPGTGRVCVPFDPAEDFYPLGGPTAADPEGVAEAGARVAAFAAGISGAARDPCDFNT